MIINNLCFVIAAKYLFYITRQIGASSSFATKTVLFFCISPATIFFNAPYSETLFCALTFGGISYCLRGKFFCASILFGLSTGTRSNGLLNIGHLLFFITISATKVKLNKFPVFAISVLPPILLTLVPFLLYQYYALRQFCHLYPLSLNVPQVVYDYLTEANLTIPGERVPRWCHQTLPFSYSSIQEEYWNVGFLRYFNWKQIPNFILAIPVLSLVTLHCLLFFKSFVLLPWMPPIIGSSIKHLAVLRDLMKIETGHPIFYWKTGGSFAVHSMFLAVFTFFFAHVQVKCRFYVYHSKKKIIIITLVFIDRSRRALLVLRVRSFTGLWHGYQYQARAKRKKCLVSETSGRLSISLVEKSFHREPNGFILIVFLI